jgi:biotin carboxyl carrier protein
VAAKSIRVKVGDRWYTVELEDLSSSPIKAAVDGETFYVEVEGVGRAKPASTRSSLPSAALSLPQPEPTQLSTPAVRAASDKVVSAPMPGKVLAVNVRPGETVTLGQGVCVLEAMKMEQSMLAPSAGVIKAVHVQPLQQVSADDPLVELE